MFVAIEGVDAVGKTSISRLLARRLGASLPRVRDLEPSHPLRRARMTYALYPRIMGILVERLTSAGADVVVARYAYSVPAHDYLFTGKSTRPPRGLPRPDLLVYLTASWAEIRRRLAARRRTGKRKNRKETLPSLKKTAMVYDQLLSRRRDVIRIDTSRKSPSESAGEILEAMAERGVRQAKETPRHAG
jgi:thymidylate kinase